MSISILKPNTSAGTVLSSCATSVSHKMPIFFLCRFCGGQARRIIVDKRGPAAVKETIITASDALKGLAVGIANHIVVPAAVILMVGAFLFYLLDVRSVFLTGTGALKRIGFCFAAAAVLIARYGKVHAIRERQMLYTGILGVATFFAMMKFSGGGINYFVNLLVIAAVWRFATGVTNNLHVEEEEKIKPVEHRLYGVERLHHEEMERKFDLKPDPLAPREKPAKEEKKKRKKGFFGTGGDAHGNPSAAVARLAVIAVITFALGEPALLSGPPEAGQRALVAVIIFLLATGVVLAAGSAAGTFRHTLKSGGNASLSMVPVKITLAVLLMVILLAAALTVPGITYRGSGYWRPGQHDKSGSMKGEEDYKSKPGDRDEQELKRHLEEGSRRSGQKSRKSRRQGEGPSATQSIFNFFAGIGKLLIIPLVLVFIGMVIYVLVKLWPGLKSWRPGIKGRLRGLLEKLKSLFRFGRGRGGGDEPDEKDPLEALNTIHGLPPREAILTAYSCLLAFFHRLGHQRPPRLTPYEYLDSLPERFAGLAAPARKLTDLYVNTAYSTGSPTSSDSKEALTAIFKLLDLAPGGQGEEKDEKKRRKK